MSEGDPKSQGRRLRLAADVLADLWHARIDHLAWIAERARLSGKTPRQVAQAVIDAAAYLDQPDPIPEPGPAVPGKEVV